MRTRFLVATSAVALLCLTGCTQATPEPEPTESYVSDTAVDEAPVEELAPNDIEPDTLLIVRALASAANGSELSLELQVHQSTRWDDVPSQTLPAAVIEDCAGLTAEQFADEKWSFTRANLTAIPTETASTEWPADAIVTVIPSGETGRLAARGILATEASAACGVPTSFAEKGRGAIAIGAPGDADARLAWAALRFGFATGGGVTLTQCSAELTPLGASLGGGAGWAAVADPADCSTGSAG